MMGNRLFKKIIILLFVLVLTSGCQFIGKDKEKSYGDPNGNTTERIQYHKNELDTHQSQRDRCRQSSLKSLQNRNMNEVRRSNNIEKRHQQKLMNIN